MTDSRKLTGNVVNPANDMLSVTVIDSPGSGGANHAYRIGGFRLGANPSRGKAHTRWTKAKEYSAGSMRHSEISHNYQHLIDKQNEIDLVFQNGPISEVGVNGITHEALLAILIDRMEGFQSGPYASSDNAEALESMRTAQTALQRRTIERMNRGVEGTHKV
ncbi:hypothetical protein PS914_05960 [Pseudomonas fluorescens]|uniref:hypothetical protein n=1 Tax=Pseudomonas fluorescens TaxID=294 RepID=UPI00123F9C83|nr:hypothetical protein [Pseudomonas fluorescens]VVQ17109.1 hypothetical protein PS914_05960 [Pseudomonas fluorescens]